MFETGHSLTFFYYFSLYIYINITALRIRVETVSKWGQFNKDCDYTI